MGCIDSKPQKGAASGPAVKGVSEQHIDLHLANKRDKRNNVFTAGNDSTLSANFTPKIIPKTREQERIIRKSAPQSANDNKESPLERSLD